MKVVFMLCFICSRIRVFCECVSACVCMCIFACQNAYFNDYVVLKEGYLDRKTQRVFANNTYFKKYVWIYRGMHENITNFLLGIDAGPTLNKPKLVSRQKYLIHSVKFKQYLHILDNFAFGVST